MTQHTISSAKASDASFIARSQLALAVETEDLELSLATVERGVQHVFSHPDIGFYVCARNEVGEPVACALILKEWSDWRYAEVWWIHSVYVEKSARKQKIFSSMYAWIKTTAEASKVKGLRLYVDKRNGPARKTYQRLGMTSEHYEMFEEMF